MSSSLFPSQPECAADAGSLCAQIYRLTDSDFLARDTRVTELDIDVWDRTIVGSQSNSHNYDYTETGFYILP